MIVWRGSQQGCSCCTGQAAVLQDRSGKHSSTVSDYISFHQADTFNFNLTHFFFFFWESIQIKFLTVYNEVKLWTSLQLTIFKTNSEGKVRCGCSLCEIPPLLLYFPSVHCLPPLNHIFSCSRPRYPWPYLGLNDGLGAGLQHGEVVGKHQELQLLCLQHHLNVVLHSSCLATHKHTHTHTHTHIQK